MALNLLSMLFPRPNVGIFKISDYDLNKDERRVKYEDYDQILCEECNQQFDKRCYFCTNCYSKETDIYERYRMQYGPSKLGVFKTSDYDVDLYQRRIKYEDYDQILCEKCNQEIDEWDYFCINCYSKETDYKRYCMTYGRSKLRVLKTSDYDLDLYQRKEKYKDYDHIFCKNCNQEI